MINSFSNCSVASRILINLIKSNYGELCERYYYQIMINICNICNGNIIIKENDVLYLVNLYISKEEYNYRSELIKYYIIILFTFIIQSNQYMNWIITKDVIDSILYELESELFPEYKQQIFLFLINASNSSILFYNYVHIDEYFCNCINKLSIKSFISLQDNNTMHGRRCKELYDQVVEKLKTIGIFISLTMI